MKKSSIFILLVLFLCLGACTAHHVDVTTCITEEPRGFWYGLWHGIIAPITFIISLFTDNVQMYEVNNNGGWYDFGFAIGAGIIFGGSGSQARRRRRRERDEPQTY